MLERVVFVMFFDSYVAPKDIFFHQIVLKNDYRSPISLFVPDIAYGSSSCILFLVLELPY